MKKLTPYDFEDLNDYITYIEKKAKIKSNATADDGETKSHEVTGRNNKNYEK